MRFQRIAVAAIVAAGLAALPLSPGKAQPYYTYPCNPFPLFWPFCAAVAIVGGVGAIITAPFRGTIYPYYPRYYYGSPAVPYYYPPTGAYYPTGAAYAPSPYYPPATAAQTYPTAAAPTYPTAVPPASPSAYPAAPAPVLAPH
jgi:hypothetical protein